MYSEGCALLRACSEGGTGTLSQGGWSVEPIEMDGEARGVRCIARAFSCVPCVTGRVAKSVVVVRLVGADVKVDDP